MQSAIRRRVQFLAVAVLAGLLLTPSISLAAPPELAAPPKPRVQTSPCANKTAPPPPVDSSEKPLPGQQTPAPMPVPEQPVGGERMADCGMVLPADVLNPPDTTAMSWVLQDLDTGAVLAAKDPHARQRPASLIKTLLALVVVRELKPEQIVIPTEEDAHQECTCVGIVAGEKYTVDQLLHGLLMHSGNDVAHAFATVLGGVPTALQKMNALAVAIGATDTRAATPSGLDGPGMSTSAYDLSLIFNQAMKYPAFSKAVGTKQFPFPAVGTKPAFTVYNDNKLLNSYPGFLGGKTGFTDDARHTYVGGAEKDGKRLAIVMVRAEQQPTRVTEQAAKLLDYGFALAKTNSPAVGKIVQLAAAAPNPDGSGTSNSEKTPDPNSAAPEESFGVAGWIIVLLSILLVGTIFIYFRRKKQQSDAAKANPATTDDDGPTRPTSRQH